MLTRQSTRQARDCGVMCQNKGALLLADFDKKQRRLRELLKLYPDD